MDFQFTEQQNLIRDQIRMICQKFQAEYWRKVDKEKRYPQEFVDELTKQGWLSILIPERYGGAGLGVMEASIVLEEINRFGDFATACHAQLYTMSALIRHGSEEQKSRYLPEIANGKLRLQSFAITEPNAGSDTTRITTFAKREGDNYVINGYKVFISRVQHTDLMMLLARTTEYDKVEKKTHGMSLFLVDLRQSRAAVHVTPIETMLNHETNELVFENLIVPASSIIGQEGMGFYHVLDGMNAQRILVAAECLGDAYWFIDKASEYAKQRVVFGVLSGRIKEYSSQ
jgi:acyl-CoA dehydrogenase